jgi:hypothetical protein
MIIENSLKLLQDVGDVHKIVNFLDFCLKDKLKTIKFNTKKSVSSVSNAFNDLYEGVPQTLICNCEVCKGKTENKFIGDEYKCLVPKNFFNKKKPIGYYALEHYIFIINCYEKYLYNILDKFVDFDKNKFKVECFIKLCRTKTPYTPTAIYRESNTYINFIAVCFRVLDESDEQVFRINLAPYYSSETNKFEINITYSTSTSKYVFVINLYKEFVKNLKEYYDCSVFTRCTPKYYKILNLIFTDGLNSNRLGYETDIKNLKEWANQSHLQKYEMKFDEKGILISRNKFHKISNIMEYIPEISSYVLYHN